MKNKLYHDFERTSIGGDLYKWTMLGITNQKQNLLIGGAFVVGLITGIYLTIQVLGVSF